MGRCGSVSLARFIAVVLLAGLPGCSSNAVKTTSFPVPATITLSPATNASMEVGTNLAFTPLVKNSAGTVITEPVSFLSSNTAVLTIAGTGQACAGSWDSLTVPQVCTPGPVGVAQVTAVAQGVSSPTTTVYVHQHIDSLVVTPAPGQIPPPAPCFSKDQLFNYQATAYNRGADITSTVGIFNWQALTPGVVTLSTTATGLVPGQVQVTAKVPGVTPLFASIGTATSVPLNFTTCAVQTINLSVTSTSATSKTVTPTVIDTLGNIITDVPLTWTSSEPATVSVNAGSISESHPGGAAIIASCTPPTCNIGFLPTLPIYPSSVVTISESSSGASKSGTLYVTSSGCGTTDNCFDELIPVTIPGNTLGNATFLPATPNSFVFNRQGTKAYLGTNSSLFRTKGLMVLDASSNSITQFPTAPGKVLAVSPDGTKVIISDTADSPNQVFVFDTASNAVSAFSINGATAADFSPDSLKAFIIAGSTLYVYSKLDALQTIALTAPANDVTFLSEGAFAYLAGGAPSSVTVRRSCDNGLADTLATTAVPTFMKTLPDAAHVIGLAPPTVQLINVATTPSGCTPDVSDTVTSFDLGQGNFAPTQLLISQDGTAAYVVASNLHSILVFNVAALTSSSLPLAGNATPIQASLSADGTTLYVAASDGLVHVVNTSAGGDSQQISFPQNFCVNSSGVAESFSCTANLIAVKP